MTSRPQLALACCAALAAIACPTPATTPQCQLDTDCTSAQRCVDQACLTCSPACSADQVCLRAQCLPRECGTRPCRAGEGCVDGACRAVDCLGVTCPAGQACAKGTCYPVDCGESSCVYGEVCSGGACVQPPCAGVTCAQGTACGAGQCLPSACAGVVCAPGLVCEDGRCEQVRCAAVTCPRGSVCADGDCAPTSCGSVQCPADQGCLEGRCADPRCVGVICASGTRCSAGVCVACATAETACDQDLDADCDGQAGCVDWDCEASLCAAASVCSAGACRAGCAIDGLFFAPDEASGPSACRTCQPAVSATSWTNLAEGSACTAGRICHSGACLAGCRIDGSFYTADAPSPANACRSCRPAASTSDWSTLPDGTDCGGGLKCKSGACGEGCTIAGTHYDGGALEPGNPCRSCQPGTSTTGWSSLAEGAGCGTGRVCDQGACAAGCFIDGAFVSDGGADPAEACRVCAATTSTTSWTSLSDGAGCGAGKVCLSQTCGDGCFIAGKAYAPSALDPGNPCQLCQPGASTQSWTKAADGTSCAGGTCQSGACQTTCSPVDGGWGAFGGWYDTVACGASCGGTKTQRRDRACDSPPPACGGASCPGAAYETQTAACPTVPEDGGWGAWGAWYDASACSASCGGGTKTQQRDRACDSPSPSCGGAACAGAASETQTVACPATPVDGGWGAFAGWYDISACSASCGGGTKDQQRDRSCDSPAPSCGGAACPGSASETQSVACNTQCCPVDGAWGAYGGWYDTSGCSSSCGGTRTQQRDRSCDDPPPSCGGASCSGSSSETQTVACPAIPVDGGWGGFGDWYDTSACSASCGGGTKGQARDRSCDSPAPSCGGSDCSGSASETQTVACNTDCCSNQGQQCVLGSQPLYYSCQYEELDPGNWYLVGYCGTVPDGCVQYVGSCECSGVCGSEPIYGTVQCNGSCG